MGIKHSCPVPPFMRYCSAIIPTMFDDSLSYYEALCALNRFIQKNLVEVINNNATVTQEYIRLVDELKEYVEHYFDNLDVQEEINNKLDAMAEDGTLVQALANFTYYVTPAMFGAVGDDTTDDTQAIQDCIDYANTNGYSVYFAPKTYLVTDSLNIYSNSVIVGNNATLHTEENVPIITSEDIVSSIIIRDLKFKGSNEVTDTDNYGIKLVCYYSTFDTLKFTECYGAIYLDTTGATGTLVENKITNCEVRTCQSGFYIGSNNNNKLTDGIFENNIIDTSNASLDAVSVGSSAGWIFNNLHIYGTNRYAMSCLNGYNTTYSNLYIESTSTQAMHLNSLQTTINLNNIQIVLRAENEEGIHASTSGSTTYGNPYLNVSNLAIKGRTGSDNAVGINAPRVYLNNYQWASNATGFTPYTITELYFVDKATVDKGELTDASNRLAYAGNSLGLSDTGKLDVSSNTERTIRFKIPDVLMSYDMRRFDLSIQGYQYWNGTHNFDYKSEITLINKNNVMSVKNNTSSDLTNFATAPAVSYDGDTNELVITFTPSIALSGCYRITG